MKIIARQHDPIGHRAESSGVRERKTCIYMTASVATSGVARRQAWLRKIDFIRHWFSVKSSNRPEYGQLHSFVIMFDFTSLSRRQTRSCINVVS